MQQESPEEDLLRQNHYAFHLAEMNKTQDVVSTGDICNQNGLLIVPKGTHISHSVAGRILQHKLLRPLEEQVQLENSLGVDALHEGVRSLLDKYPDLAEVHRASGFQHTLDHMLAGDFLGPILLQELTVLHERLPREFEKTMFCAWLSALISSELHMTKTAVEDAFLAGLAHDIGLLHISPEILTKKEKLTAAEWRAIQSHVVIGQLLLRNIAGEREQAARAVLEHHERCDGSGYPTGKSEVQLDVMGQIVGMADSVQAIRVNQFSKCGRNIRDIMPYLHMNARTIFIEVYHVMCALLQKSGVRHSRANPFADIENLVRHLCDRGRILRNAVAMLDEILNYQDGTKQGDFLKIRKAVEPVAAMIRSSGLVRDEIFTWLETVRQSEHDSIIGDLTDMDLMQNELYWQLRRVCKVIGDCLDKDTVPSAPEPRNFLKGIVSQIEGFLDTGASR